MVKRIQADGKEVNIIICMHTLFLFKNKSIHVYFSSSTLQSAVAQSEMGCRDRDTGTSVWGFGDVKTDSVETRQCFHRLVVK